MPLLPFLTDDQFLPIVKSMVDAVEKKKIGLGNSLASNVLDPFNAAFQSAAHGLTRVNWESAERARQLQKTFEHQMGSLHQSVLGALPDWENLTTGNVTDLLNKKQKLCAEVKNKHNTVKASDEASVYQKLLGLVGTSGAYRGYTAYYVTIVPKRKSAMNEPFAPSDNAAGVRKPSNDRIRKIDGYSFYALATGRAHALRELFVALPVAVAEFTKTPANAESLRDLFETAYGIRD